MKLQFVGVTDRPNNRARATVNLSGGGLSVSLEIRGGGQKIEFHDEMRVAMSIIYFNHFQRFQQFHWLKIGELQLTIVENYHQSMLIHSVINLLISILLLIQNS